MSEAERIARIRAELPGDWYRMHAQAQKVEWEQAARRAGVECYQAHEG